MKRDPRWEDQLGSTRTILRAWVLLALHGGPGHGYQLIARLERLGFYATPSRVYRALALLEGAGLVASTWESGAYGPSKKVYRLSPLGKQALEVLAPTLLRRVKSLDDQRTAHLVRSAVKAVLEEEGGS